MQRNHRKPILRYIAAAVVLGAGAYLSFQLGRYQAGFLDERRQVTALNAELAERDATIEELLRQQVILETSREIDRETYAAVEADLAELQRKIQTQEEELVFYRGIVSPGDGVAGLRVQNVEIVPEDSGGQHMLRLLLVQAIVHNDRVTGTVRVRLRGSLDHEETVLDLADLTADGESAEIPYGFRYFQRIERELALPVGFEPSQVDIEIWPREPRGETMTQSFAWAAVVG